MESADGKFKFLLLFHKFLENFSNDKCGWINYSLRKNKTTHEIANALAPLYPCEIPVIPNGHVMSLDDNSTQIPGVSLEDFESVKVVCNSIYSLLHVKDSQTANRCLDGEWINRKWPKCRCEYLERIFWYLFYFLWILPIGMAINKVHSWNLLRSALSS